MSFMVKKLLVISLMFFGSFLYTEETIDLPLYKETEHFEAFCLEKDSVATESVLLDLESCFRKYSLDFNYSFSLDHKIKLNIYPDIQSFHKKISEGKFSMASSAIAKYDVKDNSILLVSPKNPGVIHSEESAMKCGRWCLNEFFLTKKYGFFPEWLCLGLSLYEVKIYSRDLLYQHLLNKNHEIELPPFSQLEESHREPQERSFFVARYALAEFLVTKWGMDKALTILDDYSSFEAILGISKERFLKECIQYYQPK